MAINEQETDEYADSQAANTDCREIRTNELGTRSRIGGGEGEENE